MSEWMRIFSAKQTWAGDAVFGAVLIAFAIGAFLGVAFMLGVMTGSG